MYLLLLLTSALLGAVLAQGPPPPQYSSGGWRPLLNSLFARGPRHAHPPPALRSSPPAYAQGERFQVAATQYQPAAHAYFSRNSFSHPFAHYRPSYGSRIPTFMPIPDAPGHNHGHNPPASPPSYATYTRQQQPPIMYATAAPPQPLAVYAPLMSYVTAAPAVEPITSRPTYADADFTSGGRESSRYESDTQISPEALTPQTGGQRYTDFEREILGNLRGSSQSQTQVDVDSQSLEPPEPQEAPRLTPQNIRLVFHDAADEQEVRATLREKSRTANEDATFIVAPEQRVLQRQRVMLPPAPQPVVYILLRKPVITSEVKFERQEAEGEAKKPRVFITYEDVGKVLSKHIDLQTGKVKDHAPDEKI